jgi:hypothetical protein
MQTLRCREMRDSGLIDRTEERKALSLLREIYSQYLADIKNRIKYIDDEKEMQVREELPSV